MANSPHADLFRELGRLVSAGGWENGWVNPTVRVFQKNPSTAVHLSLSCTHGNTERRPEPVVDVCARKVCKRCAENLWYSRVELSGETRRRLGGDYAEVRDTLNELTYSGILKIAVAYDDMLHGGSNFGEYAAVGRRATRLSNEVRRTAGQLSEFANGRDLNGRTVGDLYTLSEHLQRIGDELCVAASDRVGDRESSLSIVNCGEGLIRRAQRELAADLFNGDTTIPNGWLSTHTLHDLARTMVSGVDDSDFAETIAWAWPRFSHPASFVRATPLCGSAYGERFADAYMAAYTDPTLTTIADREKEFVAHVVEVLSAELADRISARLREANAAAGAIDRWRVCVVDFGYECNDQASTEQNRIREALKALWPFSELDERRAVLAVPDGLILDECDMEVDAVSSVDNEPDQDMVDGIRQFLYHAEDDVDLDASQLLDAAVLVSS